MHPSKVIKDLISKDTYYDLDVDVLNQYVKIGDFPPEWVVTNIDEDDDFYYTSMRYCFLNGRGDRIRTCDLVLP